MLGAGGVEPEPLGPWVLGDWVLGVWPLELPPLEPELDCGGGGGDFRSGTAGAALNVPIDTCCGPRTPTAGASWEFVCWTVCFLAADPIAKAAPKATTTTAASTPTRRRRAAWRLGSDLGPGGAAGKLSRTAVAPGTSGPPTCVQRQSYGGRTLRARAFVTRLARALCHARPDSEQRRGPSWRVCVGGGVVERVGARYYCLALSPPECWPPTSQTSSERRAGRGAARAERYSAAIATASAVPSRTRLLSDEHALGRWTRAVRAPAPALRGIMYRDLLGFEQRRASFTSWLEPPRPALTLMIDLEGELRLDGRMLTGDWLAGLSSRYGVVAFGPTYASIDLELTPLGAYAVLGRPLSELTGQIARLDELFGASGRRLTERLREQPDWDARFDAIEAFLLARVARGPRPSPAVAWAWQRLWQTDGQVRVEALAGELGCSRRYLQARFGEQVGLPPKTVARLIRFGAVRRQIEAAPARWAEVADQCGYCDQPYLNREFRELAGTSPSEFVRRLVPAAAWWATMSNLSKTEERPTA